MCHGFYLFSPNDSLLERYFLESIEFCVPSKFSSLFTYGHVYLIKRRSKEWNQSFNESL